MTTAVTTHMVGLSPPTAVETGSQKDMSEQDSVANAFAALLAGVLSGVGLPLASCSSESQEKPGMDGQAQEQVALVSTEGVRPVLVGDSTPLYMGVGVEAGLKETLVLEEEQSTDIEASTRPDEVPETASGMTSREPAPVPVGKGDSINDQVVFRLPDDQSVTVKLPHEEVLEPAFKFKKEELQPVRQETTPCIPIGDEPILIENRMEAEIHPETIPRTKATVRGSESEEQVVSLSASLPFITGENAVEDEPMLSVNEAARLFRQALEQAGRQKGSGRQEVTLKLDPPSLGRVHLTLLHRTGVVSACFEVENEEARGVLQTNMAELKNSLVQQGIQVEELGVFMGQWSTGNQQFSGRQDGFVTGQGQAFSGIGQPNFGSHQEPDVPSTRGCGALDLLV